MAVDYTNPYQGEIIGLDRQRKLADLLMKQGMAQNNMEGQMVSGRYVGASPWQGIANLANIYVAKSLNEEADTKQQAIADRLRKLGQEEVSNITDTALGREARKEVMAGPYDVSKGIQQPAMDYPAMQANPRAALAMAGSAQTPEGRAFAPRLLDVAMPRPSELKQNYQDWLASGGKGTMMDYQREVANLKREPVSYSTVETPQGVYTLNSRTGQLTPAVDASGKPIMGKGNALTEAQGKATTFQGTMMNAAKNMKDLEDKGYNPASFKNQAQLSAPSATNVMLPSQSQQYKQAMDNFANAYLRFQSGANMSEQEIQRNLKEMMPVFGDKPDTLKQKADARENAIRFMSYSAGQGANMLAQANANLVPPAASTTPPAAPAAAPVQRAYMGSEPIITKNGIWVYEKTGKAVQ